jgi:F-type H+-transporting ATPase subunit b
MDALNALGLEPRLLLTQVVGFLIVLWLLKRFAWNKLLAFVEKRRETIAAEFEEIENTRADAESLRTKLAEELDGIEHTRRVRIQEAVHEANEIAAQIKEEARKETVALRVKANQDVELEMDKANATLRDRMTAAVMTVAEQVIKGELDDARHRQLIEQFLGEVNLSEGNR